MCRFCLSRRSLLVAPAVLPWMPQGLVEPRLRLTDQLPGTLVVALTLDACPGAFDERIALALIEGNVPATIFASGTWLDHNAAGLALLLSRRDLFRIENHGERHIPPILGHRTIYGLPVAGSLAVVRREIVAGSAAVSRATGTSPRWYRGAAGRYSPSVLPEIEQLGFRVAGYSLNADAGASLPAHSVAVRIAGAVAGDVIIAHINQPGRPSGAGVVEGVRQLVHRGARFVHLDPPTIS